MEPEDDPAADRPALNISVVGEGISPDDVSISDLSKLLAATAALLKAVADEQRTAAPEVALVGVSRGSAAYAFHPTDQVNDAAFAPLVESTYQAIRKRGSGHSHAVRSTLQRLFEVRLKGALQVGGRLNQQTSLQAVLMAEPVRIEAPTIDATTVLYGRVLGVVATSQRYEIALKPRDGGARIDFITNSDAIAEQAADLFNRNARAVASYGLNERGHRDDWELLSIASWEPDSFLDVVNDIRKEFAAQGIKIDGETLRKTMRDGEPEDA